MYLEIQHWILKIHVSQPQKWCYKVTFSQENLQADTSVNLSSFKLHLELHVIRNSHMGPICLWRIPFWRFGVCPGGGGAAEAAKPVPIFKSHFGGKGYPLLGVFIQENMFLCTLATKWAKISSIYSKITKLHPMFRDFFGKTIPYV